MTIQTDIGDGEMTRLAACPTCGWPPIEWPEGSTPSGCFKCAVDALCDEMDKVLDMPGALLDMSGALSVVFLEGMTRLGGRREALEDIALADLTTTTRWQKQP